MSLISGYGKSESLRGLRPVLTDKITVANAKKRVTKEVKEMMGDRVKKRSDGSTVFLPPKDVDGLRLILKEFKTEIGFIRDFNALTDIDVPESTRLNAESRRDEVVTHFKGVKPEVVLKAGELLCEVVGEIQSTLNYYNIPSDFPIDLAKKAVSGEEGRVVSQVQPMLENRKQELENILDRGVSSGSVFGVEAECVHLTRVEITDKLEETKQALSILNGAVLDVSLPEVEGVEVTSGGRIVVDKKAMLDKVKRLREGRSLWTRGERRKMSPELQAYKAELQSLLDSLGGYRNTLSETAPEDVKRTGFETTRGLDMLLHFPSKEAIDEVGAVLVEVMEKIY